MGVATIDYWTARILCEGVARPANKDLAKGQGYTQGRKDCMSRWRINYEHSNPQVAAISEFAWTTLASTVKKGPTSSPSFWCIEGRMQNSFSQSFDGIVARKDVYDVVVTL